MERLNLFSGTTTLYQTITKKQPEKSKTDYSFNNTQHIFPCILIWHCVYDIAGRYDSHNVLFRCRSVSEACNFISQQRNIDILPLKVLSLEFNNISEILYVKEILRRLLLTFHQASVVNKKESDILHGWQSQIWDSNFDESIWLLLILPP